MSKPVALIVDDEPDLCELLAITLGRMQIDSESCGDITSARERLQGRDYQLCLTDMRLPDGDGLELVGWMQEQGLSTPVAVITAHGNVETAVRALKLGAFDFVSKPVNLQSLRKLVETALKLPGADDTRSEPGSLLGESDCMLDLRAMIAKVARSQAPVYIAGESGTGKELVARMIHAQGARADSPFVPVNCGAIPAELMESEFFGHQKGAFTGAVADKAGLFQSAEGGTLFMDEIADLPLPMQVKLLRVIQEKSVRPVGATAEVAVDVRVLSATHKDLRAMVASGEFREDLYYRVNVIELRVPPLRERGQDVLMLAEHILQRLAGEMNTAVPKFTAAARDRLAAYHYPGNVRELENVLERAIALAADDRIDADDIQLQQTALPNHAEEQQKEAEELGERLQSVERQTIREALQAHRYNKTRTAESLGLTLRALRYRMQKLGLD
ncbi:MAG: sigma-54-dependent transcriptional regulator [Gammaproteobacteria bacterium]